MRSFLRQDDKFADELRDFNNQMLYAQFCHFDEGDPSKANGRSKSHNLRFSRFGKWLS